MTHGQIDQLTDPPALPERLASFENMTRDFGDVTAVDGLRGGGGTGRLDRGHWGAGRTGLAPRRRPLSAAAREVRGMPMTPSGSMRASDGERERVVDLLKEQTAQGCLSLEELEERTGAAYAAKTRFELQQLTEDLPEAVVFEHGEEGAGTERAPTRTPPWLAVFACCGLPRRWRP